MRKGSDSLHRLMTNRKVVGKALFLVAIALVVISYLSTFDILTGKAQHSRSQHGQSRSPHLRPWRNNDEADNQAREAPVADKVYARFDAEKLRWEIGNSHIQQTISFANGLYSLVTLENRKTQNVWQAAPNMSGSGFSARVDNEWWYASRGELLYQSSSSEQQADGSLLQRITLANPDERIGLHLFYQVYPNQAVIRSWSEIENRSDSTQTVGGIDILNFNIAAAGKFLTVLSVDQWKTTPRLNFAQHIEQIIEGEGPVQILAGSNAERCTWFALRDDNSGEGIVVGWEFNGRSVATLERDISGEACTVQVGIYEGIKQAISPGNRFQSPKAFVGVFRGNWDKAAWVTQRFVETHLARPLPDENYPYVQYDSWGYLQDINEQNQRAAAETAADLGVEVFVLDLGWARMIGDWRADPGKFPSGLAAFANYVHSKGMKFGLHIPFAEASPQSPVLRRHADWTASDPSSYFGASSLCLANRPTKNGSNRSLYG